MTIQRKDDTSRVGPQINWDEYHKEQAKYKELARKESETPIQTPCKKCSTRYSRCDSDYCGVCSSEKKEVFSYQIVKTVKEDDMYPKTFDNKTAAARYIGMNRNHFYQRIVGMQKGEVRKIKNCTVERLR